MIAFFDGFHCKCVAQCFHPAFLSLTLMKSLDVGVAKLRRVKALLTSLIPITRGARGERFARPLISDRGSIRWVAYVKRRSAWPCHSGLLMPRSTDTLI